MKHAQINPLRDEVKAVVRSAIENGEPISKSKIWKDFQGRGYNRGTVHRWMDEVIKPAGVAVRKKAVTIQDAIRNLDHGGAIVTLTPVKGEPIDFEALLRLCLNECEAMMSMAKDDNGVIRNARLLHAAVDQLRRTLSTAATIYSTIQSQEIARAREFHERFIDELLDLVMSEVPTKRDAIILRMDKLRVGYRVSR